MASALRRVSVVIPCYNAADYIERALRSVAQQTLPPYEVIVVDDGSTDRTPDIVAGFRPSVVLLTQPNGGVAAARNAGTQRATGDWIAFLDADDEWGPAKLARQHEVLSAHPDLRWCAANAEVVYADVSTTPRLPRVAAKQLSEVGFFPDYLDAAFWQVFMQTSGMVIERDLLASVGDFDTTLRGPEDVDLWCRLAFEAPAIGYVEAPSYRYYAAIPGSLGKNGLRAHYTLLSMDKLLRLSAEKSPEVTAKYRRYARQTAFRLLVAASAGREQLAEALVAAHCARLPPSRGEVLALNLLHALPAALRRRVEGRLRDVHRVWCVRRHRAGPLSSLRAASSSSG
jgi:glycosyltransferase involved in cell wall biosynthesis